MPAKRNSTIYDVAELAGVSARTVSRVINGAPNVSASALERVEAAIASLGFEQNPLAASLRRGRGDAVAVVVGPLTDPFFASLTSGVEQAARDRGVPVLIATVSDDGAGEADVLASIARRQIAGAILVPMAADQSYLNEISPEMPVVFADRLGTKVDNDVVLINDEAAAAAATAHLITHGHRRIALIGDLDIVSSAGARERGYRSAHRSAGIPTDDALIAHCPTASSVEVAVQRMLSAPDAPTAIFSSNAKASLAIVPLLHAIGRTDVAIVCFGDFPMADALSPAVTVIDQDPVEMGAAAARMLFERLDAAPDAGLPESRITILPTRLVERGSGELPPR